MGKKAIVLFIALVIMAIFLIATSAYFSGLVAEKRITDNQRFVLQALWLADTGANHGLSELRERIRTDLKAALASVSQSSLIKNYVTNNDSLGFLRDYACAAGGSQFVISSNQAVLPVSGLNLNTSVQGSYNANIIVAANGDPTNPSTDVFIFPYKFSIDAAGQVTNVAPNALKHIRLLQGSFTLTVRKDNFAKFALFTSHHTTPGGTTVWFTANTNFTGPVATNTRFAFANNPSGHFTEEVTQHLSKALFYNNGYSKLLNADSNPPRDMPIFDRGFRRGEDTINLESSLSQADLKNEALGGSGEPGGNGIYVPNDGTNVIGGIYVRGNQGSHSDDAVISMGVDTDNNPVYTITQSSTTRTITVDYQLNQTKVQAGQVTNTYNGVPDGVGNEGIIIYVNDDIKGFSGTVQKDTEITVASERDLVITNNVLFQQYTPNPLSAQGYSNNLGIISWGGNVRIGTAAPNNINIHGVVMAPHGVFTVDNYNAGQPRGTATLLGGVISDYYGAFGTFYGATQISGYGRNFVYDARMLEGITPPYFPYMAAFSAFDSGLNSKLVWQDAGS